MKNVPYEKRFDKNGVLLNPVSYYPNKFLSRRERRGRLQSTHVSQDRIQIIRFKKKGKTIKKVLFHQSKH